MSTVTRAKVLPCTVALLSCVAIGGTAGGLPAWNDAGHRLVALIAWHRMTPAVRTRWVEVLRHHPRFEQDFVARMPTDVRGTPREARWVFMHAATWPDIARGVRVKQKDGTWRTSYHFDTWHYINEPIYLDAKDAAHFRYTAPTNLNRIWRRRMPKDRMNLVQALKRARHVLTNAAATRRERAVLACWILHLVGDIHQPLHTTALFSKRVFPEGDRGGNRILLMENSNLHAHWDRAAVAR